MHINWAKMMTKAQQILELYDGTRTTNEIAGIVGCRPDYVRVVARQRKGGGQSDIDRRYLQTPAGRKAHLDGVRRWRIANPEKYRELNRRSYLKRRAEARA